MVSGILSLASSPITKTAVEMDLTSSVNEFTRIYLALFITGVASFYSVRIFSLKRHDSARLIFPGERYCSTWWNHMAFRLFRVLIWGVCLVRWFAPKVDHYLGIFTALRTWPMTAVGNIMLTLGFVVAVAVHFSLGRQWRSGIDPNAPVRLKTDGPYRFTRNPMYIGVALAQLGFFLALPSLFTLICLIVGLTALQRQVVAEEEHLADAFPVAYASYQMGVPRWI